MSDQLGYFIVGITMDTCACVLPNMQKNCPTIRAVHLIVYVIYRNYICYQYVFKMNLSVDSQQPLPFIRIQQIIS